MGMLAGRLPGGGASSPQVGTCLVCGKEATIAGSHVFGESGKHQKDWLGLITKVSESELWIWVSLEA